jgi:hypothetical protein
MVIQEIVLPSDRKFGIFFGFIFLGLSIFLALDYSFFGLGTLTLSVSFFLVSFVYPKLLRPLNKGWAMLGLILGMVVNPVIMGALFFLLVTPISLWCKFFGRDELSLRDNESSTWWHSVQEEQNDPTTLEKMY